MDIDVYFSSDNEGTVKFSKNWEVVLRELSVYPRVVLKTIKMCIIHIAIPCKVRTFIHWLSNYYTVHINRINLTFHRFHNA